MVTFYTTKIFRGILVSLSFCLAFNLSFGNEKSDAVYLGSAKELIKSFSKINPSNKQQHSIKLAADKTAWIIVSNNSNRDGKMHVFGNVVGYEQATFFLNEEGNTLSGKVIFRKSKEAFDISTNYKGDVFVTPIDIHQVMCFDYNQYQAKETNLDEVPDNASAQKNNETTAAPLLNSLPSAARTIYLDFDGENVTNSNWGNINAAPSSFSNANITTIWTCMSEDYSPFNVNVTTDVAVFNSAPTSQRMKIIFTPTNTAAPGAGGVAYLNSWGSGEPCWVFNSSVKSAEEAAAHECGHTLGLSHDGTASQEYYAGHASWGPIMGAVYSRPIVHWSKGEYTGANNQQDDLTIISNRLPYRVDDHGSTIATATALVIGGTGTVSSSSNFGVIGRRTDLDIFSFTTTGGTVSLTINAKTEPGSASVPDLDIQARILDVNGTEIIKVDPTGVLSTAVTISQSLSAGNYFLEIDGVGYGSPLNTGYSDFGSLGQYFISGTIPGGTSNGIHDQILTHNINVFPNPSNGILNINIPLTETHNSTLEIVNSLGQSVFELAENTSGNYEKRIDISSQPAGMYYIILKAGDEVWKGKVILK